MKQPTVQQVINIAKTWINNKYADRPDFVGAHLVGSLHHMSLDSPFETYRDVDLAIILDSITEQDIDDTEYEGLIIEAILVPSSRYTDAEKLLADASNASIFAADHSILFDPRSQLKPIVEKVQQEYNKEKWVTARRDEIVRDATNSFAALSNAKDIFQAIFAIGELNMNMIAILTLVHLKPLTHRRNMLQLKQYVHSKEEKDIFERLHTFLGSANFTEETAKQFLSETSDAFDYAVSVHKTPVPYDHKLDPCVRPYLVQGTKEMFKEGGYRESVFWIALFMMISCAAIQADGDDQAKAKFLPMAGKLLHEMGIDTPEGLKDRVIFANKLLDDVKHVSNQIIKTSPDIQR